MQKAQFVKKAIFPLIVIVSLGLLFLIIHERRGKAEIDTAQNITVGTPPTAGVSENKEIPEYFPQDFPLLPDSKLIESWSAENADAKGLSLVFETDGSVNEVSLFYENSLTDSGWTFDKKNDEESYIYTFEKKNISGFLGIVNTDRNKTVVSVTMGIE